MDINETDGKEAGWGVHPDVAHGKEAGWGVHPNVSWKQHMTNEELYGDLPKVTTKIAILGLRPVGHCQTSRRDCFPAGALTACKW